MVRALSGSVVLEAKNVSKSFPGVKALKNVNMRFCAGEVHALAGENGAGKSTLMNILSGVYTPDPGSELSCRGTPFVLNGPKDARNYGITMVHQENSLVQHLTVYENIFLGHFETKGMFVDKQKMIEISKQLLERLEIAYIDPTVLIKNLSSSEKQLIEIAKAISYEPEIIILDEPTASLTLRETASLMKIIDQLKKKNVAIIYISHHLEEVFEIADTISVLRDGEHIGSYPIAEMDTNKLISLMVGRKLNQETDEKSPEETERRGKTLHTPVVLEAKGLTRPGKVSDASFTLHKGEILGFAGLVGAGRSELMEMVFGTTRSSGGSIHMDGKQVRFRSPQDAIKMGIGMLTEDRKLLGILPLHSVEDNINVSIWPSLKRGLLLSEKMENDNAESYIQKMNVKTASRKVRIGTLSGGNQQKALLARLLSIRPRVLILDEPTHGIDVGAKAEIYNIINQLSESGVSILLISSEMPELLFLSHRIAVMHEGKIKTVLEYPEVSQEAIMNYASNVL